MAAGDGGKGENKQGEKRKRRQGVEVVGERTIKRENEQGRREAAPDNELGIFVLAKHMQARTLARTHIIMHTDAPIAFPLVSLA